MNRKQRRADKSREQKLYDIKLWKDAFREWHKIKTKWKKKNEVR